jgi:hypothetical protein
MATISSLTKELNIKIVYYGTGMSGKTTNLRYLHKALPKAIAGEMISLDTEEERTLFFDFLPMELGELHGFKIRLHLYTVPGQVFYEATRELVLQNADGVVFVVDSQKHRLEENLESLESLERNLKKQGLDIQAMPLTLQYNKRDLETAEDIEVLDKLINRYRTRALPAVASTGDGVFQTLKDVSQKVIQTLS